MVVKLSVLEGQGSVDATEANTILFNTSLTS